MTHKNTHVIESDIFDISDNNLGDKFKDHFNGILRYVKMFKIRNAKVTTRIKELNTKDAIIHTELEEDTWKYTDKD